MIELKKIFRNLTETEKALLKLMALGYDDKVIMAKLKVSKWFINKRIKNFRRELNITAMRDIRVEIVDNYYEYLKLVKTR